MSVGACVGVLAALPLCGPGPGGAGLSGTSFVAVNPSLPARFPCVCCSPPQAAPGRERIPLRDHTLGIQMESTFSGVRLPHRKRVYRFSLMSSLSSQMAIFTNKYGSYPSPDPQPGFCHSTVAFSYLNSDMANMLQSTDI